MFALWGSGVASLVQGDIHRALPFLERAMALCQETGLSGYFAWMAEPLGAAYTLAWRDAEAVPLLTRAVEWTRILDGLVMEARCHLALGEGQLRASRPQEAHALVGRALALARARQERGHEAYALRLLGEVVAHRQPSEVESAAAAYQQALTLAEKLGMRPLQAHCHRGLGILYTRMGCQEPARTELSVTIILYRAMEMTFWLPKPRRRWHRWRS